MKFLLTFLVAIFAAVSVAWAVDCNREQARLIIDTMQSNYGLKYEDSGVSLHVDINGGWNVMDLDRKNRFLAMIANSDACVHNKARGIFIYSFGEKVAEASPLFGLKVLK